MIEQGGIGTQLLFLPRKIFNALVGTISALDCFLAHTAGASVKRSVIASRNTMWVDLFLINPTWYGHHARSYLDSSSCNIFAQCKIFYKMQKVSTRISTILREFLHVGISTLLRERRETVGPFGMSAYVFLRGFSEGTDMPTYFYSGRRRSFL